jgi:4-diphosphocytidyl-2-C-methyl-D-erythritol kinase
MISFPNCKINIGLNILSQREDGFHNLQTVFYPLPVYDALELVDQQDANASVSFNVSGIEIPSAPAENICLKAYELLKEDFVNLPPVSMHLHKAIPMGAGLGGGSADGAFTLRLLNDKYQLNLSETQLLQYAARLGSDCPFFIINRPCYAEGRGELLTPVHLDLSAFNIALINPGIHINTAAAFKSITPGKNSVDLRTALSMPVSSWRNQIINDFETGVFYQHPEIEAIKNDLYDKGAIYAAMSGTGSTVYGLFPKASQYRFNYPSHYFSRWI